MTLIVGIVMIVLLVVTFVVGMVAGWGGGRVLSAMERRELAGYRAAIAGCVVEMAIEQFESGSPGEVIPGRIVGAEFDPKQLGTVVEVLVPADTPIGNWPVEMRRLAGQGS